MSKLVVKLHVPFVKSLALFNNIDDATITTLLEQTRITRYDKGQILFKQGDQVDKFFIVKTGWLKLYRETIKGEEAVVGFCKQDDCFANAIAKEYFSPFILSCQAIEETLVYEVPFESIRKLIEENNVFAINIIRKLSESLVYLQKQVEYLSVMSTSERIACFLLQLYKDEKINGKGLKLPFSKELIARYLGMKAETFSRSLHKLKSIGVEVKADRVFIRDKHALIKHSGFSEAALKELA